MLFKNMKLSLRIPLILTIVVLMAGIIIFVQRAVMAKPFLATQFIIWLVASAILIGITVWSWLRNKPRG